MCAPVIFVVHPFPAEVHLVLDRPDYPTVYGGLYRAEHIDLRDITGDCPSQAHQPSSYWRRLPFSSTSTSMLLATTALPALWHESACYLTSEEVIINWRRERQSFPFEGRDRGHELESACQHLLYVGTEINT